MKQTNKNQHPVTGDVTPEQAKKLLYKQLAVMNNYVEDDEQ